MFGFTQLMCEYNRWKAQDIICVDMLKEKSLAISYNGIDDLFSTRSVLSAGVQTCHLFENDLMATRKWSKETNSDFIARI